jgi:hypothetical protein
MARSSKDGKFNDSSALTPESLGTAMHTLMTKIVQELKGVASTLEQERLFFPQGIQRIHLVLTFGPKDAPIAGIEVDVSGQKGALTYGNVKEENNPMRRDIRVCEDDKWSAHSLDHFRWVNTLNTDVTVQADPQHPGDWPFGSPSPITVHPAHPVDCDIRPNLSHGSHKYEVVGCGKASPRTVIIG